MGKKGYGVFVCIRSVSETGNVQVRLLTFKSYMAPLNESTQPSTLESEYPNESTLSH